jgi:hypothetical protein
MSEPEPRAASTTTVPKGEPGDNAVAARKVASARLPLDRHLRHHGAGFDHPLHQRHGVARVRLAMAAGEDADGAGLQARDVGALVDPARQA